MIPIPPDLSTGAVAMLVGALVPALISLGIFARKEEIANLRAEMYENFVKHTEVASLRDKIDELGKSVDHKLDRLSDSINQLVRRP